MIVENLIIFMGIVACIFFIFRLKDSKNKENKSMSLIGILLGILIIVIGKNWLDTKKDYITKIETIIKTNTPAEKKLKEEFIRELEKKDIYTLDSIYKNLKHKSVLKNLSEEWDYNFDKRKGGVGTPTKTIKGEYMDIFKNFLKLIMSKEFLVILKISMLLLGIFLLISGDEISNKRKKKSYINIIIWNSLYIYNILL